MICTPAVLAAVLATGAGPAWATRSSGSGGWGRALEVPGTAALNVGGMATVYSVSCTSPGDCVAGGYYGNDATDSNSTEAFLVTQRSGTWGTALGKLPGIHDLYALSSEILTVSCSSAGNCAAGGDYIDYSGDDNAMLIGEHNGHWSKVFEVTGKSFNFGGEAQVTSVSCPSDGDCVAVGFYSTGHSNQTTTFFVSERNGRWGKVQQFPGMTRLNTAGYARMDAVSCGSAGNCSAGGFYTKGRLSQALVVSERNGRWGRALAVPGIAAVNLGGAANVQSVSCASAGNCAAGGYYEASKYNGTTAKWQAFAVNERHGRWGKATPLLRKPSTYDNTVGALAQSVSCGSAGNCVAGGSYVDRSGGIEAFLASEQRGTWGKAVEVPGTAGLNKGNGAEVNSVSCASAGNCSAGGNYTDHGSQAFVIDERGGRWGRAFEIPGMTQLNVGNYATLNSLSCTAPGQCTAGGSYFDKDVKAQAFVDSQT